MKRSVVGIECPLCQRKNRAIPLTYKPANQAARIHIGPDLSPRVVATFPLHYDRPDALPAGLHAQSLLTFWRCESCDLVFHTAFSDMSRSLLVDQIYNTEYSKTMPQIATEIPQYRASFVKTMFGKAAKGMRILVAETAIGGVAAEMKNYGLNAGSYLLMNKVATSKARGIYDLICSFNMLEQMLDPVAEVKRLMKHANERTLFLFSYFPFSFRNEHDHLYLSPRNGYIRMFSPKTIDAYAERLRLKVLHLNQNLFVLYRELPDFAKFLADGEFSEADIVQANEANEVNEVNEANDNELVAPEEDDPPEFTRMLCHTDRISVRETRYGLTMYYHHDALVGNSLEKYGQYLDADRELLQQLLQADWHVVDACANIGVHIMMMAPMLSKGWITAIEPYTMSYRLLEGNIALNQFDRISTRRLAVGAEIATTRLSQVDPNTPGSLAAKGWHPSFTGDAIAQTTIDTLDLPRCDFIHLCAPEQEPAILRGTALTLERFRPALLVNCINKDDFLHIQAQLSALDYRLYWHIQPFYLEDNFFKNTENVFDSAGAAKILALHAERGQNIGLKEIKSAEDWIIPD